MKICLDYVCIEKSSKTTLLLYCTRNFETLTTPPPPPPRARKNEIQTMYLLITFWFVNAFKLFLTNKMRHYHTLSGPEPQKQK